jgi:hypothetical protein
MKCPYCSTEMTDGYFIVGGGVWWCESERYLEHYVAGDEPTDEMQQLNREHPLHCIIGTSGCHGDHEKWPKHGSFCQNKQCLAFIMRPTPRN